MKRITRRTTWGILIGFSWLAAIGSPASATVIGIPGNPPTNLPAGPPNPTLPGYNLYPFMLNGFLPPSPNPLPSGVFAESPLQFNLIMQAGLGGPSGQTDPIVAAQTFNFFIIGDYWSVQAQLEYKPATSIFSPSDIVTMTADSVHRIAPHPGEFAPGPAIPSNVTLNAGTALTLPADFDVRGEVLRKAIRDANLPAGARFGFDFRAAKHTLGTDEDVVFGLLVGQIGSPNNPFVGNEFEFWIGGVAGLHAPTPEPATLLLFATTAAGLAWVRWRRKA